MEGHGGVFISTKATSGRMALDDEDAAEMTRQRSDLFGGDPIFVASSPR